MLPELPATALKLTEVDPAGTVTEAGTLNAVLFVESVTVAFPLGAGAESVSVQVAVEPAANVPGEHSKLAMPADKTVIVPAVPATTAGIPAGNAPMSPVIEIGTTDPLAAVPSVTVAVATVPLPIGLAFMPAATQETDPPTVLQ